MEEQQILTRLANIVGASHLSSASADRHAYAGLSPSAVVWPGSPPEATAVLKACTDMHIAVGISGGGSRLAGHWPVEDLRQRIMLDTRRMTNILDVDELSLTVHTQTGILLGHLEEALNRHSLSLGLFPGRLLSSSLGGLLASPHPSAYTPATGWLIDNCLGLSVGHADGSTIQTRIAPRRATGPDVAKLYVGSHGGLGIITTAVMRVFRLPEEELPLAFLFPSLPIASSAIARVLSWGLRPARISLLHPRTAERRFEDAVHSDHPLCFIALAGSPNMITSSRRFLDDAFAQTNATELPRGLAKKWWSAERNPSSGPISKDGLQGCRVLYSRLNEALSALPETVDKKPLYAWLDEFTLQGATLWLSLEDRSGDCSRLSSTLLNMGLSPFRTNFPPLIEELKTKLDPSQTLVVMES